MTKMHAMTIGLTCALLSAGCSSENGGQAGLGSPTTGVTAGTGVVIAAPSSGGAGAIAAAGTGVAGRSTTGQGTAGRAVTGGTTAAGAGANAALAGQAGAATASAGTMAAGSGGSTAAGSGGMLAAAGASGRAAGGSDGAEAGSGGSDSTPTGSCKPWPAANGSQSVSATIQVSGTYDGMFKRFTGSGALGSGSQDEGQDPLFILANGATLKNVVIGAPAADGVHCKGSCTLENVWWEDVGEDAATLEGSSASQVMKVECGGAKKADDKIFQHNGPGTIKLNNFYADTFGKLYRSCGNCKTQNERHVEMSNIDAKAGKAALAGINTNYNDTARFTNITIHDTAMKLSICDRYTGNSSGDEPTKTGSGPDGKYCMYSASDIHWQP